MLGRVYRKFRGENDSPLVNYVVVIQDNDSNNPARLYDSNGNLLSPHGEIRTNSEGEIDVYVLDGQMYKLSLLHPTSRLVLSVENAVDPGAVESDFESDTQLSKIEITQIRNLLQSGVAGGQAQIAFQENGVTVNVGLVDGSAVVYSGISTEHVIVLRVEVNAGANDRYDIEIYDGPISNSGTLVYRAQQVQGDYLDSFAFYHQCQNTYLSVRIVNLRQDGASFSANVKVALMLG